MKHWIAIVSVSAGVAFAAEPYRLEVLRRDTDLAEVPAPQCDLSHWIHVKRPVGIIEFAEVGAFVRVTGYPSVPTMNGIYRITRYSFRRDRDRAHVDSEFWAVCIVTTNPVPR